MKWIAHATIAVTLVALNTAEISTHTHECINRADYSSCTIFNACCDFRCRNSRSKKSTCIMNETGVNVFQTECVCSSTVSTSYTIKKSRHSRLDLIAGILFIFVIDMLLLSFTF